MVVAAFIVALLAFAAYAAAHRPASVPSAIQRKSIDGIYQSLHPGMTEEEMTAANGPPDSDGQIQRPGIYGGGDNRQAEESAAQAIPPGRADAGGTRMAGYSQGGRQVQIILISTRDADHPQVADSSPPVWVVMQYHLY